MRHGDEGQLARKRLHKADLQTLRSLLEGEPTESEHAWYRPQRMLYTPLAEDAEISGIHLSRGSEVYYTNRGRLTSIILSEDTRFYGNTYPAGSAVYFYKKGGIDWVSLTKPMRIHSRSRHMPTLSVTRMVSFYPNHNIKETTLKKSARIQGHQLYEGSRLHFSSDGVLVWASITRATSFAFDGLTVVAAENSCVEFHRNGRVRSLRLAETTAIDGHRFQRGTEVKFAHDGRPPLSQP